MPKNNQQAPQGHIAVFTNENGNCSICKTLFASELQGLEWAEKALTDDGAANVRVAGREVVGEFEGGLFGASEVRYTVYPMEAARADAAGHTSIGMSLHVIR